MMAVSPLFYTNLPGFDKNWLWNPDRLWFDRWQEVLFLQPDYVEIISWNDWGESDYIGPQDPTQWDSVFRPAKGKAPHNYVDGFAHDGFRQILPHVIDLYKNNSTMLNDESLLYWGRSVSSAACDGNGTTLNTASQLQIEYPPQIQSTFQYFYWGIFTDDATVTLTSESGVRVNVEWVYKPQTWGHQTIGFYLGQSSVVPPGPVTVQVLRGNSLVMQSSTTIKGGCHGPNGDADYPNGLENFNMWTGYATQSLNQPKLLDISGYTCVLGISIPQDFQDLCYFSCFRGYCPPTACNCNLIGPSSTIYPEPGKTPGPGYSVGDVNFAGLCGFACGKGYCPSEHCTSESRPVATPTISPFNPFSCTGGTGLSSGFDDLCQWTCAYGYCPIAACKCTSTGPLNLPPPVTAAGIVATFLPTPGVMAYDDLCRWACERGHCPSVCKVPSVWGLCARLFERSLPSVS